MIKKGPTPSRDGASITREGDERGLQLVSCELVGTTSLSMAGGVR